MLPYVPLCTHISDGQALWGVPIFSSCILGNTCSSEVGNNVRPWFSCLEPMTWTVEHTVLYLSSKRQLWQPAAPRGGGILGGHWRAGPLDVSPFRATHTTPKSYPVPNGYVFPMVYGIAARFKRLCGLQVLALEPSGDQQPVPGLLHVAHQPRLQIDEEQRPRNVSCAVPLQLPWGQKVTVAWVGAQTCGPDMLPNPVCPQCMQFGVSAYECSRPFACLSLPVKPLFCYATRPHSVLGVHQW